jgi:RND family efflux transporter MFP subunit
MNLPTVSATGRAVLLSFCVGLTGCARARGGPPTSAPIPATVSYPIDREITDYAEFTARTAAVESVEVRARVWGYLQRVNFMEGTLVEKGDVLFEIDPKSYQAQYDASAAQVEQREASLRLAKSNNLRYKTLFKENPGAVSSVDLDKYEAEEAQAVANLSLARANLDLADLNLKWTKVIAPVSGRVSRAIVTEGNLVQSGESGIGTLLTTIVSVDPVYAYFDVDERTVLRVRKLIREGKAKSARERELRVSLSLADEEGFPHSGTVNFVDNQVNPKTGTLRVRGTFPNKDEAISPGFFARVRVPIGFPRQALLITDRAIDTDQGQKIVYVVDGENKVVSRPIRLGALHDGLRVIDDGLQPRDRVIVNGLQQVRPGVTVEPEVVEMPGRQKSEVGGQRSEVGNQKSEVSARMTGKE